jgi:hypothetical protein
MRGILAFPIRIPQHLHYGLRIPTRGVSIAGWVKFDTPKPWFRGKTFPEKREQDKPALKMAPVWGPTADRAAERLAVHGVLRAGVAAAIRSALIESGCHIRPLIKSFLA